MTTRVRIIGIGSPFGDDRLGWVAAERLRDSAAIQSAGEEIEISILDRPGATLISVWRNTETAIVIDAVRSGAPVGTVHRLDPGDIDNKAGLVSAHDFDLASVLSLAKALKQLPPRLLVYGIEADIGNRGTSLSAAVDAALPELVRQLEPVALQAGRANLQSAAAG